MNPDFWFALADRDDWRSKAESLYALAQFVTLLELLKEESNAWCWKCGEYTGHNEPCWGCYVSRPGYSTGQGDWE